MAAAAGAGRWLASLVGAGVLWLPLVLFLAAGDHNRTSWVGAAGRSIVRQTVEDAGRQQDHVRVALVVAALIVFGALVVHAVPRARAERGGLAAGAAAVLGRVPPVLLGIICLAQETWVDRYLIGIVPAFGVLAGVAVAVVRAAPGRSRRWRSPRYSGGGAVRADRPAVRIPAATR